MNSVKAIYSSVEYKGQVFKGMTGYFNNNINTYQLVSKKGEIIDPENEYLLMSHDIGDTSLYSSSMLDILNLLTASKLNPSRSKTLKNLKQRENYQLFNGSIIDLPFCGHGPNQKELLHIDKSTDWYYQLVKNKYKLAKKQIYLVASGFSAVLAIESMPKIKNFLKGIILVSPMVPTDGDYYNSYLLEGEKLGQFKINNDGLRYMDTINRQAKWHLKSYPFLKTPTLIFNGANDDKTTVDSFNKLVFLNQANNNINHHLIDNVGRNTFNLLKAKSFVFDKIFEFCSNQKTVQTNSVLKFPHLIG